MRSLDARTAFIVNVYRTMSRNLQIIRQKLGRPLPLLAARVAGNLYLPA